MDQKWDTVWYVFQELSDTISLTSLRISCTSTSSTTLNSTSTVTSTTTSHIFSHTTGYQYTDATTSSNSTSKSTQNTCRTTSTVISKATSIPTFPPIFFPRWPLHKNQSKLKTPSGFTIPKRCQPTLDIFTYNNIRVKRHKKYILLFKELRSSNLSIIKCKHQFLNLHSHHHCQKIRI